MRFQLRYTPIEMSILSGFGPVKHVAPGTMGRPARTPSMRYKRSSTPSTAADWDEPESWEFVRQRGAKEMGNARTGPGEQRDLWTYAMIRMPCEFPPATMTNPELGPWHASPGLTVAHAPRVGGSIDRPICPRLAEQLPLSEMGSSTTHGPIPSRRIILVGRDSSGLTPAGHDARSSISRLG